MARFNTKAKIVQRYTAPGAKAYSHLTDEQELRRSVMACLLWEDQFYEDGQSIADRIRDLSNKVSIEALASISNEARNVMNLRHVPLLLLTTLVKRGAGNPLVAQTVESVVSRADEMGELLSLYWADKTNKKMLPAQLRKGLARAFAHFDEYRLAKYDRDDGVKLRDVLRLVRPTPANEEQSALWKRVKERTLKTPDTWEVALSGGADKKEAFTRLITERKLGYMALLRNLRNMAEAGVDKALVEQAIIARKGGAEKVLPFRYLAAAKHAPQYEPAIDQAFTEAVASQQTLPGKTLIVVDVSGSMHGGIMSAKSQMNRMQAAASLAAVLRGMFEDVHIYATAGSDGYGKHATAEVPPRTGMALIDAISSQTHPLGGGGIFLKQVMDFLRGRENEAHRIIVLTDEADCDTTSRGDPTLAQPFGERNYLINVGSYQNGIGYGPKWLHIDGFSEGIVRYIREAEGDRQSTS